MFRLLKTISIARLQTVLALLLTEPAAGEVTAQALTRLEELFGTEEALGVRGGSGSRRHH